MKKLQDLQNKIGINFKDIGLLEEAITHRSYLNENRKWAHSNNERLEFLGDAVLELIVTESLFKNYPDKEEGELTIYRAALVNTKTLSSVAEKTELDKNILLSRGEAKDFTGRGKESISANAVEAVIGAIYLDRGYDVAKEFVCSFILPKIKEVAKDGGKDSKSLVQELAQERYKITPTYQVLEESGPAHDRTFRVALYFDSELKAEGTGNSKQEAETCAAQNFLNKAKKE
jgi:ribonuclease-3